MSYESSKYVLLFLFTWLLYCFIELYVLVSDSPFTLLVSFRFGGSWGLVEFGPTQLPVNSFRVRPSPRARFRVRVRVRAYRKLGGPDFCHCR